MQLLGAGCGERYCGAMPWKRYWTGLVIAVPLGVLLGLGAAHLISSAQLGWGSANALAEYGAVLGAIDAVFAAAGVTVGVQVRSSRSADDPNMLVVAGSVGASAGAASIWLLFGLFFALMGGLSILPLAIIFAVASGLIAGISCAIFMIVANQIALLHSRR
ncbi:hypothetical protein G5T42_07815 [Microbacterium sp. 4R-513]|uniref:hypothetical protein n=1 Tax=Microbacterium sp. 4R-513 TaxID=2567934 RepID=UPI0013E1209E|nr:hypothetical protein [Microbacterium sp. 4R-513]QIG39400.1 hypothetical protein G5T42_07815 [Microbacterium sp. 4R-513]